MKRFIQILAMLGIMTSVLAGCDKVEESEESDDTTPAVEVEDVTVTPVVAPDATTETPAVETPAE